MAAMRKILLILFTISLTLCFGGVQDLSAETDANAASTYMTQEKLLFMGQDLDSIRGYMQSECCLEPDGMTAYLSFYNLLLEESVYGGLGMDASHEPVDAYSDWGAGPKNAWKTATEFGVNNLAIGLFIAENDHPGALDGLLAGEYDANISRLAAFMKKLPVTIYLRVGYEFDGAWNLGYEDAPRYVSAYRRIVDGLRSEGVNNVKYVWQASASTTDDIIDGGHDDILDWYPGDDYVDWFSFSWFMHPHAVPTVELAYTPPTPHQLAREVIELAEARGKPVLIAESAPQGFDLTHMTRRFISPLWDGEAGQGTERVTQEEVWNLWFQPLFDYLQSEPAIRGLAYINCHWDSQDMWDAPWEGGYWGDTRLEVNLDLAKRFNEAVARWRMDEGS